MSVSKRDVLVGGLASAALVQTDVQAAGAAFVVPTYTLGSGEAIIALLESAPYVQFGTSGPIIYEIGFRGCGPCMAFSRKGTREMVAAGFQVRSFIFAPSPTRRRSFNASSGEMASVAEIYRTRSAEYLEAWYRANTIDNFANTRGVANFEGNATARLAVAQGREKIRAIAAILDQSVPKDTWGYPAFIWRVPNGVKARFGFFQSRDLLAATRGALRV
jgi:hypothetical protein